MPLGFLHGDQTIPLHSPLHSLHRPSLHQVESSRHLQALPNLTSVLPRIARPVHSAVRSLQLSASPSLELELVVSG